MMSLLCNAALAEFSEKGKKLHDNLAENEVDIGNVDNDGDDDFGFGDDQGQDGRLGATGTCLRTSFENHTFF